MNPASTNSPNAFLAIFWGGLACGVLDITQAIVAFRLQSGLTPSRVFQSVASGLLGKSAFQGGMKAAVLGGCLHFLIAFIWATIYYVASRKLTFMLERPVLVGLLYGEFVWLVMTLWCCRFRPSIAGRRSGTRHPSLPGRSVTPCLWDCPSRWRCGDFPENLATDDTDRTDFTDKPFDGQARRRAIFWTDEN